MTVTTPGDARDVLVAMNPASLKANRAAVPAGGTVIVDIDMDAFTPRSLAEVGLFPGNDTWTVPDPAAVVGSPPEERTSHA